MSENGPYPPELEALCDALINSDCDSAVKSRLFNILNNWEVTKGFKLCESNKDMVKVLIQLYLVNETNVSKQVGFCNLKFPVVSHVIFLGRFSSDRMP